VKYPGLIATKGRAGQSSTIENALKENLPIRLIVEPQDALDYCREYPTAEIYELPENNKGITYARNFCLNMARREGFPWFWMLDDDIKQLYIVIDGKVHKAPMKEVFARAEALITMQPTVAIGALEYQQYAWSAKKQMTFNSYCDQVVLVSAERTKPLQYREDCKEDRDFVLQVLQMGMDTCRTSWLAFSSPKNGSNKGGLHDAYKGGLENHWSAKMVKLWPGVCELKTKKDGRPDVKIHWKKMRSGV